MSKNIKQNMNNVKNKTVGFIKSKFLFLFTLLTKIVLLLLVLSLLMAGSIYALTYFKVVTPNEILRLTELTEQPEAIQIADMLNEHLDKIEQERLEAEKQQATVPEINVAEENKVAADSNTTGGANANLTTERPNAAAQPITTDSPNANTTALDFNKIEQARLEEEAKRLKKLTNIYSGMKPKEAADIMSKLDDATIVQILTKMEEEQASQILALFDPARAATVSQVMLKLQLVRQGQINNNVVRRGGE